MYRNEYVIRFYEGNFLHLTGVKTNLSPLEFYKKAKSKHLTINDFDCGDSRSVLKGTVREKVKNLKSINVFFDKCICVQEKFKKGKVSCLIASSNGKYTIGFTGGQNLNPMTLLNKNQIDQNSKIVDFKIIKNKVQ